MPHRNSPSAASAPPPSGGNFRRRYDALEAQRAALVARLEQLGDSGKKHPGYKRALKLLNDTFRKSKLAQRLAVLQAASWLIDVLELLTISV